MMNGLFCSSVFLKPSIIRELLFQQKLSKVDMSI